MYRNLFAVFATLALGVGAASASTATTESSGQSLQQRIMAAQKTIGAVTNPATETKNDKVAQYYGIYRPFYNAFPNYFRNYFRNYYSY